MALRWCAAGMIEADEQFRRINGHLHLPKLREAPWDVFSPGPRSDRSSEQVAGVQRSGFLALAVDSGLRDA